MNKLSIASVVVLSATIFYASISFNAPSNAGVEDAVDTAVDAGIVIKIDPNILLNAHGKEAATVSKLFYNLDRMPDSALSRAELFVNPIKVYSGRLPHGVNLDNLEYLTHNCEDYTGPNHTGANSGWEETTVCRACYLSDDKIFSNDFICNTGRNDPCVSTSANMYTSSLQTCDSIVKDESDQAKLYNSIRPLSSAKSRSYPYKMKSCKVRAEGVVCTSCYTCPHCTGVFATVCPWRDFCTATITGSDYEKYGISANDCMGDKWNAINDRIWKKHYEEEKAKKESK